MIKKFRKKCQKYFVTIIGVVLFFDFLLHIEGVITALKDLDEEL